MHNLSIAIFTLGCKVNQSEAETLAACLNTLGHNAHTVKSLNTPADVYIVNTCTVTSVSDKKSRQMLRRAKKYNPDAKIAVCGCMTRTAEAQIPEADFIFDAREPQEFILFLQNIEGRGVASPIKENPRTRAFIKIQDGCDNFCAYCIVPYVRPTLQSKPLTQILKESQTHIKNGCKEIVLSGIQVAAYGDDTGETLPSLIRAIATLDIPRIRLSSLSPTAITPALLAAIADTPALCPHFHLSLQSGCEKTLKNMNRKYTPAQFTAAAAALRQIHPNAAITTDIIVGFPDETDDDFNESLRFARQTAFAQIHVFEFSPRQGTKAADMPNQVPPQIRAQRGKTMRDLAAQLQQNFFKSQINTTATVLIENTQKNHSTGFTQNYCPVKTHAPLPPNTLQNILITGHTPEYLINHPSGVQ